MSDVMLWAGAGQIGMAIARRTGFGRKIIVGDKDPGNAAKVAEIMQNAGFDIEAAECDISAGSPLPLLSGKARNIARWVPW